MTTLPNHRHHTYTILGVTLFRAHDSAYLLQQCDSLVIVYGPHDRSRTRNLDGRNVLH